MTLYHVPHLALGAELTRRLPRALGRDELQQSSSRWWAAPRLCSAAGPGSVGAGRQFGAHAATRRSARRSRWSPRSRSSRRPTSRAIRSRGSPSRARSRQPRFGVRVFVREICDCLQQPQLLATLMVGFVLLSATIGARETLNPYVSLFFWELPESQIRYFGAGSPAGVPARVPRDRAAAPAVRQAHDAIVGAITVAALGATLPVVLRLAGLLPQNGSPLLLRAAPALRVRVLPRPRRADDQRAVRARRHRRRARARHGAPPRGRVLRGAHASSRKLTSALGPRARRRGDRYDRLSDRRHAGPVHTDECCGSSGLIEGPIASLPALIAIFFYARYRIDRAATPRSSASSPRASAPQSASQSRAIGRPQWSRPSARSDQPYSSDQPR